MSLFLHVRAGEYRFLIAADRVREVSRDGVTSQARRIDCRTLFETASGAAPAVEILIDEETVLALDEVLGMEKLDPADFRPFPAAAGSGSASRLFDAVTARPVGGLPLPRWSGETLP